MRRSVALALFLASSLQAQGFLPGGGGPGPSVPDTSWPNDPASHGTSGWTVESDQGWTGTYPASGSGTVTAVQGTNWTASGGGSGTCNKTVDATAPGQPTWIDSVLQITYANGFVAGVAPCTVEVDFTVNNVYIGFWFKHSSNWYGEQSCVHKMLSFDTFFTGGGGSYFYEACGVGAAALHVQAVGEPDSVPYSTYDIAPGPAGVQDTSQMARNTWHQAEMLWVRVGTNVYDVDYWLDGKHQIHCTPVSSTATCAWSGAGGTPTAPDTVSDNGNFQRAHLYPDWGGGGDTLTTGTQYFYVSHIRVSIK